MGVTDSRSILSKIEAEYKSVRKYCDPVYGQITVIQHKTSKRLYALIEKTFLKMNPTMQLFLKQENSQSCLLKPQNFDSCDMSLCSDIKIYFFLFEFSPNNLQNQITRRMEESRPFKREQALNIFSQQVQIISILRQKVNPETSRNYRFIVSNSNFICSPMLQIKALEPVFKNEPQTLEQSDRIYLSPEACKMAMNGQSFRVKEISNRQSSVVFTLALNFMQLLLLADISMVYVQGEEMIDFEKLNVACSEIRDQYGQQFEVLLTRMLQKDELRRPSLFQVKRLLKNYRKNRKSISRYEKDYSTEIY